MAQMREGDPPEAPEKRAEKIQQDVADGDQQRIEEKGIESRHERNRVQEVDQ